MKNLFALVLVLLLANPSFSQKKGERIEAMKIAFLTRQLDLTPTEAQQFWPVYNEYNARIEVLRKTRRYEQTEAEKNLDSMKDKDVESFVDGEIGFRQKELDIQKEYHAKFKSVLPLKKVAKLYRAEEMFKRELLKKMQEQKKMNGN